MEEKIKFYSQYLFQDVLVTPRLIWSGNPPEPSHEEWVDDVLTLENIKIVCEHDFPLFLKPLSAIYDEDCREVAKLLYDFNSEAYSDYNEYLEDLLTEGRDIINRLYTDNLSSHSLDKMGGIVDYLRSKGYAVNWNGLSPENQVEKGWVRLDKEK